MPSHTTQLTAPAGRASLETFRAPGPSDDVVTLLRRQHAAIRAGFRRALPPGPDRATRFAELRRMLALHEAAEEAHVHPVARKVAPYGKKVVKSRLAEEKSAKKLLKKLGKLDVHSEKFTAGLVELRDAVLDHARHEEREEFPALKQLVKGPRLRMLAAESKVTQAIAPTRPHPRVNSQLANKAAAPLAGPADRGRDLLGRLFGRH